MSVNEAFELRAGDKDNPVWVNEVRGEVLAIVPGRAGAAQIWNVKLGNEGGGRSINVALWNAPTNFAVGDVIEVGGTGNRRTAFKGEESITTSQRTEIQLGRGATLLWWEVLAPGR